TIFWVATTDTITGPGQTPETTEEVEESQITIAAPVMPIQHPGAHREEIRENRGRKQAPGVSWREDKNAEDDRRREALTEAVLKAMEQFVEKLAKMSPEEKAELAEKLPPPSQWEY